MSGGRNDENTEALFLFELLVESIRIEKESTVSDELALGVRLLDFPTLLIYQPKQSSDSTHQDHRGEDKPREFVFNRGKSCFFKMNMSSLSAQLHNSPLYAMVLDVKEEVPKLVGTSLISLSKVMHRIRHDETENSATASSCHGERRLVGVCNLMGEKIGSISLSYKLLSLGAIFLPHITDNVDLKSTRIHGGQERILEKIKSTEFIPLVHPCTLDEPDVNRNGKASNEHNQLHDDKQDRGLSVGMQTKHKPRTPMPHTLKDNENSFEDFTTLCPPHLFYTNTAEEKDKKEEGHYNVLNLNYEALTLEDAYSAEDTSKDKMEGTASSIGNPAVGNKQRSEATPNVFSKTLQQLPLLNALRVELSELNDPNPQQRLSIHPNLAWIYGPASTETVVHRGVQTRPLQKTNQEAGPRLKHMRAPRLCSTPAVRPASVKLKDKQVDVLIKNGTTRATGKKLVYGTTKTFNLRLSARGVKPNKCVEELQNETQTRVVKEKAKTGHKSTKSSKQKLNLNRMSEKMMQTMTLKSAHPERVIPQQGNQNNKVDQEEDGHHLRNADKSSLSGRDSRVLHIPSLDVESAARYVDKKEYRSQSNQSNQSQSQSEEGRESPGSSPKSSLTNISACNEDSDYADDFNSLEPSDAYSPDPMSSPEPSRTTTPRPSAPICISGSDAFQGRAVLPVPIKAPSSPQRTMRGTHIIRPLAHDSALSFSSDDGDEDGSASSPTTFSRKQSELGRERRNSASPRGKSSESPMNSAREQGFSEESI